VWLEEIRPDPTPWDLGTYARAAHLLGRLAADQRVAALTDVGRHDFDIRTYRDGRLAIQVLPMLRDEGIWRHPLVAEAFDEETRSRLLAAADRADDLVEEVLALPRTTSHGDACPNNLLRTEGYDGFVLIDFGFWGGEPVGFDLSQLLVGDVQVGRRTGEDLQAVEDAIVPAYVEGLRAEGCHVTEPVVRRSHALQLMIFTGFSCLPWEHLGCEPTPELRHVAAQRAAIARFSLDLLDDTEPASTT
jgi:aminoglycoside/choline kinase family phosphotransferase